MSLSVLSIQQQLLLIALLKKFYIQLTEIAVQTNACIKDFLKYNLYLFNQTHVFRVFFQTK